ncbi:MAG: hypothetical protein IPJ89_01440 [Candidatus Iainarchaeum archaeon]|uniref:Uncharacterized protein n=1 Tax=Candidatus Iainarchaeum sp. TaxID=3101447 RepID=A0A7T9DKC6_9ARCH|nr:MAG: hypothetical protein IPJ89_01440 [Candidatus Diapherotrites archaeon]
MGIFDGRLDLLLLFIAQVVQIVLSILIYIRLTEMVSSHHTRTRTRMKAMHASMEHLLNGMKFSRMLRNKKHVRGRA